MCQFCQPLSKCGSRPWRTMSDHVAAVCRAAYFQLRQLRLITCSLTADDAKLTVQAFITCRLDYCNSLFYSISDSLFRRLQSLQNAAVPVITGTSRCDHVTPVLRQLHWLPVQQRVKFKLAVLGYKSFHGLTAPYLTDDCQLVANTGRCRLWLADVDTCIIPRTNTRLGDRSFTVAGQRLWNTLLVELRRLDVELVTPLRLLKTHLFRV